jgi:hypothetical protein
MPPGHFQRFAGNQGFANDTSEHFKFILREKADSTFL